MDTNAPNAAGEQPAATTDLTTTGAQPVNRQVETAASSLESLTSEQLLAALEATEYGEESTETTEEPEPEITPPVTTDEEEPAPAGESTTTENRPLRRLPLGGIEEAQRNEFADAANLIREGMAKDLAEAVAILHGTTPQEVEQPAATEQIDTRPAPQTPASVAAIQSEIVSLREQRKAAKQEFDTDAELSLTDQIEDLQLSLLRAENAERETRVLQGSWDSAHDAACDQVEAKYADFAKSEPDFYSMLEDRRVAMEARKDPALQDPKFIIAEADKIAGKLGWNKPATPAPKARAVTPNGQDIAPAHQSAGRLSRPEASRMIQEIPIEELRQLVCTE